MSYSLGYLPDVPDHRDLSVESLMKAVQDKEKTPAFNAADLPSWKRFRRSVKKIQDQGRTSSCVGQALVYAQEIGRWGEDQKHVELSALHMYWNARRYSGISGDNGAYIRAGLMALVKIGACPETMWPQVDAKVETQPPQGCDSAGQPFRTLKYYRCDNIDQVKWCLSQEYPVVIGFPVVDHAFNPPGGLIRYPSPDEDMLGGHAICLIGYSDANECFDLVNSWGTGWGEKGFGRIHYDYFRRKNGFSPLASDMWAIADV